MRRSGLESVAEYERLVDLCPGVLFRQSADFSFDYISPKIEEWSGFSAEEWLRQPNLLQELVYEPDSASLTEHRANRATLADETNFVFRIRNRKTGRITHVQEFRRPVRNSAGKLSGFEGVWTDISAQALAAQQLDAAAWQTAFGLVTVGAAHDLNNKLTGILSLSDLYLSEMDQSHPLHEGLGTIKQSAQQASQLLHQLAALHQGKPGNREHADLNQLVTATADFLRRVISTRVKIETVLQSHSFAVTMDRVRLQQLLIAWALQAAARMPKRGTLKLETVRASSDGKELVLLTVSDTRSESASVLFEGFTENQGLQAACPGALLVLKETPEAATYDQFTKFACSHKGTVLLETEPSGTRLEILLPKTDFAEELRKPSSKPWLLIVSEAPDKLADVIRHLEDRGLATVVASKAWEQQLDPTWFQWDAVLIHARSESVPKFLDPLRARKLPVRTIVWLTAGEASDLDESISNAADLLILPQLAQGRAMEKIMNLFV